MVKGSREAAGEQAGVGGAVEELLNRVDAEPGPALALEPEPPRGHVAVVTGGSSGIGRATAVAFARGGVHVAFNHFDSGEESRRMAEETGEMLSDSGVKVFASVTDVRDPEEASAFIAEAHDRLGGLHILVNNAGIRA